MAEPNRITISGNSELAQRLKDAAEYLDVDTGETLYRLYVGRKEQLAPSAEQVRRSVAGIRRAAGAWKDLVDAEEFKAYVAQRRRSGSRPSVRL